MVFMLLEVGDDQLNFLYDKNVISPITGKPLTDYECVKEHQHFKKSHIMIHQEHVNAVMMAIKPGICSIWCQKYNK